MRKQIIKAGDKFNKLTAIKFSHKGKGYRKYWLFKCDCGNEKVIYVNNVKSGHAKSCGCSLKENCGRTITHGMARTKSYSSWEAMKNRCLNKNNSAYKNYGGRGIKICPEWLGKDGIKNFYEDMGERPENKFLDRINNNGNYEPTNCKWSTMKEQQNNRSNNHLITFKGKTQNIKQWSEELGIKYSIIHGRLRYGWSIERALTSN